MKQIFIPAKSKSKLNESKFLEIAKNLPKKLAIAYSIQFKDVAYQVKELLEKKETHNISMIIQVLGCSQLDFVDRDKTDAILLVGEGKFHALSLAHETKFPVFVLEQNKIYKISDEDLKIFETKQKAPYVKFLNAKKIGVLISTKPGQEHLKRSLDLMKKFPDKKTYFFLGNNMNPDQFENFQIDSWVNSACPRLDMNDPSIINIARLEKEKILT